MVNNINGGYNQHSVSGPASSNVASAHDRRTVQGQVKPESAGEAGLSKKAQNYLDQLRKMYGDMDIVIADPEKGEKASQGFSGAQKEYSLILSPEELEKMASDKKFAADYRNKIQSAVRMSEQIDREYGFLSQSGGLPGFAKIDRIGFSFEEDGTNTFFAGNSQNVVQADNMEGLLKKISGL